MYRILCLKIVCSFFLTIVQSHRFNTYKSSFWYSCHCSGLGTLYLRYTVLHYIQMHLQSKIFALHVSRYIIFVLTIKIYYIPLWPIFLYGIQVSLHWNRSWIPTIYKTFHGTMDWNFSLKFYIKITERNEFYAKSSGKIIDTLKRYFW